MTVITVFRSRLRTGVDAAYGEVASQMSRLVREMPGFVDESFFRGEEGERVTIVRFRDAAAQRAWAQHPDHLAAQRRGRSEFYEYYDITVSEETYAKVFRASDVD
ncbi:MAG: antibiotic biosynthesis monooxygenase [Acidobacteria bacterium]|nr:antibiotic biosynthesis monooxygenase [Acidobacteriota bacterium]